MKSMVFVVIALASSGAVAQTSRSPYPSCDIAAQHRVTDSLGGNITDPLQAHIAVRANILQADIGTARKARRLSERESTHLWQRVDQVRQATDDFVRKQGFLSAAERASYDRELDEIARPICR